MRVLEELLAAAQDAGLEVTSRPDAPVYLADAVRAATSRGAGETSASVRPAAQTGRLVVMGEMGRLAAGDWFLLDLPRGVETLAPRRLAADLAAGGAQAREVMRLPEGRAIVLGRAVAAPEAVGPSLDGPTGRRSVFEAERTASDQEVLILMNADVLTHAARSAATAAALSRAQDRLRRSEGEVARLITAADEESTAAARRERALKLQLASKDETEARLRRRIGELSGSVGFRAERKIKHVARRLLRRSGPRGERNLDA
jgi:hypothetical protein